MKKISFVGIPFILLCMFLLVAPSNSWKVESAEHKFIVPTCPMVCLDADHNGKTIDLKTGTFVHVDLIGTPSTGYSWYLEELDENIVDHYCDTVVPIPPSLPGSPSSYKWFFQAIETGETDLVIKYYRSWEGPGAAIDTFEVHLVVH